MATTGDLYYTVSTGTTISAWTYSGTGSYEDPNHDGYIKVDKGSPDKAQFVIFYAEIVDDVSTDPMIFCKNQKELDKEMSKLLKRDDVDKSSIRVFSLIGGMKEM